MERSLFDTEETARVLLNSAFATILLVESEGKILDLNDFAARAFGKKRETLIGKNALDFFPKELSESRYKFGQKVIRTGKPVQFEDQRDNRWFSSYIYPVFDVDGNVSRFAIYSIDKTSEKKLEQELMKIHKLESLGVLAGGIAHDFNNILTSIVSYLGVARLNNPKNANLIEILDEVEKASMRARDLTQQLLTFSKGGAPIKFAASINNLIKESAIFALRGSNITCDFHLDESICAVDIDKGQMSQVINNLVINAIQAMPKGGEITIRSSDVFLNVNDVAALETGDYILINLEDSGCGIHPDHQSMVFDPFFTTKQTGTGLGLSLSYSIINNHNGHLTFSSDLGKGTTFNIYLPASEKPLPEPLIINSSTPIKGGKILLMDDDEAIRESVGMMLSEIGYRVETCSDEDETLSVYKTALEQNHPFDAVIMDLTIPGKAGGKYAIEQLLGIDPGAKVIVSSGYSTDPIMTQFEKYGFAGVLPKPYNLESMSHLLHSLLDK